MEYIEEFIQVIDIRIVLVFMLILAFLLVVGIYGELKRQNEKWDLPNAESRGFWSK